MKVGTQIEKYILWYYLLEMSRFHKRNEFFDEEFMFEILEYYRTLTILMREEDLYFNVNSLL